MYLFLTFIGGLFVSAQQGTIIYEGFHEGMTKEEVLMEYEKNSSKYTNIIFGKGIDWKIAVNGFSYNEYNLLYGIDLIPVEKENGMSSYDFTKNCLHIAKKFIEDQGFEVFYKPDQWDAPAEFDSFWGLIMINKEKNLAAYESKRKSRD